jgi:FixJ family two-component response regulator
MNSEYITKVWLLDNNIDYSEELESILNKNNIDLQWFDESQMVIDELYNSSPPDLLLLDLCLNVSEEEFVSTDVKEYDDIGKLADISGIKFLTLLRNQWPKLPVMLISEWVDKSSLITQLTQHAICFIKKGSDSIPILVIIAQKAIIGIRVNKTFYDVTSKIYLKEKLGIEYDNLESLICHINLICNETITELNNLQNYFFFVMINEESNLAIPNTSFIPSTGKGLKFEIIEAWNNRILGFIDDVSFYGDRQSDKFYPGLPFSKNQLLYHNTKLIEQINLMGKDFFKPYLLRECAKVIYHIYFDIQEHTTDTGKCIFDESQNPAHLLNGIEKGVICDQCKSQMIPKYAFGGWSDGRNYAAELILGLAKRSLLEIKERENNQ